MGERSGGCGPAGRGKATRSRGSNAPREAPEGQERRRPAGSAPRIARRSYEGRRDGGMGQHGNRARTAPAAERHARAERGEEGCPRRKRIERAREAGRGGRARAGRTRSPGQRSAGPAACAAPARAPGHGKPKGRRGVRAHGKPASREGARRARTVRGTGPRPAGDEELRHPRDGRGPARWAEPRGVSGQGADRGGNAPEPGCHTPSTSARARPASQYRAHGGEGRRRPPAARPARRRQQSR